MSENFYTILTNAGLAAIANAVINQTQVNFAKLGVGDGNGAYYTPTQEATALRNQVWIGNISSVTADTTNPNWVNVETVIPGNVGGFEIRELGIFDDNNVLLAIGKLPLTYKPNFAEGSSKDLYIKAIFEVTNASAVTLKVDPSVIYASKKYVDDKVAAVVSGLENAQQQLKNHEVDYVKHPGSGVTTRSANTYSVTLDPAPDAYVDLMGVVFKADADVSNSVVSINVNGLGPRLIYKTNKSHPTLKKDAVYSIRYSASVSAFILQGEGGSGNAQPSDVRKGKTATVDNGDITGTLDLSQLIPGNIKNGVTIDGVTGNLIGSPTPSVGDATVLAAVGYTVQYTSDFKKIKEIICNFSGRVRITFDLYGSGTGKGYEHVYGQIYINGVPKGIIRDNNSSSGTFYSEDFDINNGDRVQLYARGRTDPDTWATSDVLAICFASNPLGTVVQV